MNQQELLHSLPSHLRSFVAEQDYQSYTPRDQAVWRFLLHQLVLNLKDTAHPVYVEGLRRTGISLESIPKIEEMNDSLSKIGWRAVVVDGFVPPAVFMEFQSLQILVIAVDMRSYEHMLYTPAPDIVHESAGHAPFIIDVDYAEFLQRFGVLGRRAISNKQDMDIYDAIRNLSIVKESSSSGTQDVERAEQKLKAAIDGNTVLSEASLLSRLHWWTVEYGLVGEVDDYRIFGAGLLSSVGESVSCLNDEKVQKRLLTVDAIDSDYDITNEQELLYVTKSCRHLGHVLHEFARNMCCNVGGAESVRKAIEAQTVNTVETNSGVEISGQVEELICDAIGNPTYLRVAGPVQLAFDGSQLDGHGIEYHAQGFGSPIGRLERMERCLSSYSMDELAVHDIRLNEYTELAFLSGIKVRGKLTNILRKRGKNILMSFIDCTVTDLRGELLFSPDWGTYDMAVGDEVVSVYGGSADQLHYPIYPTPSARVKSDAAIDTSTQELMVYYQRVRDYRTQSNVAVDQIESLINEVLQNAPNEWLLLFELAELHDQHQYHASVYQELINSLKTIGKDGDQQTQQLVRYAMQRLI